MKKTERNRKKVIAALRDPDLRDLSNASLGRRLDVDGKTIAKYRKELSKEIPGLDSPDRIACRGDSQYIMNTGTLGPKATPKIKHRGDLRIVLEVLEIVADAVGPSAQDSLAAVFPQYQWIASNGTLTVKPRGDMSAGPRLTKGKTGILHGKSKPFLVDGQPFATWKEAQHHFGVGTNKLTEWFANGKAVNISKDEYLRIIRG